MRFSSIAACTLMVAAQSTAQTIDPRVIQQLQGQLQGSQGNSAPAGSPLDNSRANAGEQQSPAGGSLLPGGRVDTVEEQAVRRAQARRELNDLYEPSSIEQDYRERLDLPDLRQFGYDALQSGPSPTGVVTGAVGDDYVLGIGDELVVSFQGATSDTRTVRVDREGRLVVGQIRPVQAAGRTLGSVRAQLAAETRRTLLATDVNVSVGNVRAVSVFVGGEVARPGQYSLTSLADVATALAQAGGPRRTGSLRQIRVSRAGGGTFTVDLYGLLGIGPASTTRLRDGDRIIVPVIGPTVAVTGSVARPAIYELRGPQSVDAVIAFAGGAVRVRGAEVVISRIGPDGAEQFVRAPSRSATVLAGDALQVLGGSAGGALNRVTLRGAVDNPGARPVAAARTVLELVGAPETLRSDTYQVAAVLIRRDAITGARVFETINLSSALRQSPSPALRSEDQLVIFSRRDIDFLNSSAVRRVVLGQPNPIQECRSLNRFAALVRDTQPARFSAVTRGSFLVDRDGQADLGSAGGLLGAAGNRPAESTAQASALLVREQSASDEGQGLVTRRSASNEGQNSGTRRVGAQDREERDELRCPTIFEEEPDLLPILLESAISIGGAVRRPGAYPVGTAVTARQAAAVAEGVVLNARGLQLDVNRAGGGSETVAVPGTGQALDLTTLLPGDDVRFNAAQGAFEGSGVLLAGEFGRPGLYAARKDETLGQLIARAGGVTTLGYPYGIVLTRRSVREAQQEGFRRTARELNNSLLALSARRSSDSGGGANLAGAAALIQQIATTEAPGRVVVEGDPRVLAIRPDLDTLLEPGDSIFMPKRPSFVLVLGDVNSPGALQFVSGKSIEEYVSEAGGTLSTADRKRTFLVLPNGTSRPLRGSNWGGRGDVVVPPGSTVIVPKNIDPLFTLDLIRNVTSIVAQIATALGTVAILATR